MSTKVKCPNCNKETPWDNNKWRPFCSERCKMVDLGTWAKEDYRISEGADHVKIDSSEDEDELYQ